MEKLKRNETEGSHCGKVRGNRRGKETPTFSSERSWASGLKTNGKNEKRVGFKKKREGKKGRVVCGKNSMKCNKGGAFFFLATKRKEQQISRNCVRRKQVEGSGGGGEKRGLTSWDKKRGGKSGPVRHDHQRVRQRNAIYGASGGGKKGGRERSLRGKELLALPEKRQPICGTPLGQNVALEEKATKAKTPLTKVRLREKEKAIRKAKVLGNRWAEHEQGTSCITNRANAQPRYRGRKMREEKKGEQGSGDTAIFPKLSSHRFLRRVANYGSTI